MDSRILTIAQSVAAEAPSRPYTVGKRGPVTGPELLEISVGLAEGFDPDERIAVVSDHYPLVIGSLLGALASGSSVAFIYPSATDAEIQTKVYQFDATKVLSTSLSAMHALGADVSPHRRQKGLVDERAGPIIEACRRPRYPTAGGSLSYIVLFTSGSAGRAKMVAHTEGSLIAGYRLVRALRFELLSPTLIPHVEREEQDSTLGPWYGAEASGGFPVTYLSGLPAASVSGLSLGIQALLGGERIVETPAYDPVDIVAAIEEFQAMSLGIPPITGQRMLRSRVLAGHDLSSLFVVGLGGSGVPPGLHGSLEEAMGCRVVTGYGSTELGGVVTTTRFVDPEEQRWTTVGRPVPGVQLDIDEDGELLVRSPAIAAGYLSEPGRLRSLTFDGGWFRTGDTVSKTESGAYRFLGRKSGVIARGGRKIYPETIEGILEQHQGVRTAAVVGTPSRVAGEEDIVAYVELIGDVSVQELRQLCLRELGSGLVPRVIHLVDDVPRRQGEKVNRAVVRDWARSAGSGLIGSP